MAYRIYAVPESVRKAIPGCPFVHYIAQHRIPDDKLIPFYEKVLMPIHRKVVGDLEKAIRQSRLN